MTSVNDKQVGGSHYKTTYQHWDFVCDTDLHYLLGCATKYVARWKKKNGVEDLEKAIHYLHKAVERRVFVKQGGEMLRLFRRFCSANFPETLATVDSLGVNSAECWVADLEVAVFMEIYSGNYKLAVAGIKSLIATVPRPPDQPPEKAA